MWICTYFDEDSITELTVDDYANDGGQEAVSRLTIII